MAANGIPLHCNICPRKPNFSDVSHLLTHISSKGHLSNYYKVKVRSSHEEASRHLIDTYDRWYGDWGVEQLMSERMHQKDKRRTRARPAIRSNPAVEIESSVPRSSHRVAVGSLIDPHLAEQQQQTIKVEHSVSTSPYLGTTRQFLRNRNTCSQHTPYWPTVSCTSSRSYTCHDNETSNDYSDPNERRRRDGYSAATSCLLAEERAEALDTMAVSESTKLKGIYWPGMDIFDSATLEMRRKRNQKKDSSVVEQLELNSQEVEATELIFTPQGSFKRQRRISCSDSDDEVDMEIKVESPHSRRKKLTLLPLGINTPIQPEQPMLSLLSYSTHTKDEERYNSSHDESALDKRGAKRKLFDVFQDADVHLSQPAGIEHLTSDFLHKQSHSTIRGYPAFNPFNDSSHYNNKENILPSLQHCHPGKLQCEENTGFHYSAYTYGLEPEQMFLINTRPYHHTTTQHYADEHDNIADDDQRTITAPGSPSTC